MTRSDYVRWFDDLGLHDIPSVGGKNASLGELRGGLGGAIRVPEGFAVTAAAYRDLIAGGGLWPALDAILHGLDTADAAAADAASRELRRLVEEAPLPAGLEAQVDAAYRRLEEAFGRGVPVAVRSSATAEDLPGASFAGQHESFLNVRGAGALMSAFRRCLSSLFTVRAISYRRDMGFAHQAVALSVGVQRMIRADTASSGVIFTLDTESGFRDVVMVTGVWGLGEAIVQGIADPDEFLVHKPTLAAGFRHVLRHRIGAKQTRLVRAGASTRWRSVPAALRRRPCLADDDILELASQAVAIEAHYSRLHGRPTPMDVEWAKDGPDGALYILQARPETVHAAPRAAQPTRYRLTGSAPVLLEGRAVGERIAAGPVALVTDARDLDSVRPGAVLVAAATSPDWEPAMKRAAAIVTEHGGRTCHAAIVARELGLPAVVGAEGATRRLKAGQEVTVSCAEGMTGRVLEGRVPFAAESVAVEAAPQGVELMVNIADPDAAFRVAALPVAGVGLARIEFIISGAIGAHPMALLHPEQVAAARERKALQRLVGDGGSGAEHFVRGLAEGVGVIAAAFHPRPVIVRLSDFKTNEYAALPGGAGFEKPESNPMIGFRGASRYVHPAYRPAFELECRALARVRNDMGLKNLVVMVPFCRRLEEARQVIELMAANGLRRGEDGLQVYVMCEIPSNVVLIDEFAALFDGFSIGSNDLTQLTLGIDRDSAILAAGFDEEDPAVLRLIERTIEGAHRHGRHVGICGQAPSDRPGFAEWLLERGIDSISLNPDSIPGVIQRLNALPRGGTRKTAMA